MQIHITAEFPSIPGLEDDAGDIFDASFEYVDDPVSAGGFADQDFIPVKGIHSIGFPDIHFLVAVDDEKLKLGNVFQAPDKVVLADPAPNIAVLPDKAFIFHLRQCVLEVLSLFLVFYVQLLFQRRQRAFW